MGDQLTQGEDELITAFESRLRLKAKQCDFNACSENCKKRCMARLECGFDKNQDEIIHRLVAGMRDLQKQLWADNQQMQDLPALLTKIKAHERADTRQAASSNESGSFVIKMKCHKCGKMGHAQRNCKVGEGKTRASADKCGFCGGPSKCKMKKCKAYNSKCNTCGLFGHCSNCCTDVTKTRARKVRDVTALAAVEDSGEESNTVRLSNVSQEKISHGTQKEVSNVELSNVSNKKEKISKSQGKGGDSKVTANRSRGDDIG